MFILQKNKMRKGFIFAGLLAAFALSYLFYRSCKRDTLVISPMLRISVPDSSWLYGSFDLEQTKKDIAFSTLLNGDFNKIFQTDTTTNTLLKILRSPNNYSITEQDAIRYFSVWKDSTNYKGLLFALENDAALKHAFKSDSFTLKNKIVYSFRSREGIWLYNSTNLLFVSGSSDSLAACRFFAAKDTSHIPVTSNHSDDTLDFSSDQKILISGHINTLFVPTSIKPTLSDSALISFNVMSNDALLDVSWMYKGFLTYAVNQSSITHHNNDAALFCMANLNVAGMERILNKIPTLQKTFQEQKKTLAPLLTAVNNNNLTMEFNGWKKIKSSYYISLMNDEFETVLQKKDSSIIEPIFKISLEQSNKTSALNFLTFLQKKGLISKGKQPFTIIYGNFDSEMRLNENNTFIAHNKHSSDWTSSSGPEALGAALLIRISPASLKGLTDSNIDKPELFAALEKYNQIKTVLFHVQKEQDHLRGNIKIEFEGESHPFISLMKMFKNSGP